jgi:Uma2 family endonuclease
VLVNARASELEIDEVGGPLRLRWRPSPPFTNTQLEEFCRRYDELRIERDSDGTLTIMSPAGWRTGSREAQLIIQLGSWAKRDGSGVATTSSAGFYLPNGAMRAPDAAWTARKRLDALPEEELEHFLPIVPDFAVELRSPSDRLREMQLKMLEYVANGVTLAWLLDPSSRIAYVYRSVAPVQVVQAAMTLDASPELPGFVLDLAPIWG